MYFPVILHFSCLLIYFAIKKKRTLGGEGLFHSHHPLIPRATTTVNNLIKCPSDPFMVYSSVEGTVTFACLVYKATKESISGVSLDARVLTVATTPDVDVDPTKT